jgi:hypothetical protein
MTLVVEDGTRKANAEAYATVVAYKAYCDGRGITYGNDASIEVALRKGADYMEAEYSARWAGYKATDAQALSWPRYEVPRPDSPYDDADIASDVVPAQIVRANILMAVRAAAGEDLLPDQGQAIKRERVEGAVDVTYQDGTRSTKSYPAVDGILAPLLAGGGAGQIPVSRA